MTHSALRTHPANGAKCNMQFVTTLAGTRSNVPQKAFNFHEAQFRQVPIHAPDNQLLASKIARAESLFSCRLTLIANS